MEEKYPMKKLLTIIAAVALVGTVPY